MADENATVIDSLIVTLGLDPSDYDKGRKAAAADLLKFRENMAKTAKDAQADGKRAGAFFGQIKQEALGLFAVVVGAKGLESFAANTVTNLSAMGRAAKAMGMDVSQLAAFQNMIVRNGGSADAARASLQGLAQAMEQWRVTGNTAMLPWLNRVGASANDDPFAVYMKFAKWAEGRDAKQVNLVGQNLGFDEATINEAMKGVQAVREGMAESYRLGVPKQTDIDKVQALQNAFLNLRQAVLGNAQALLEKAAPALTTILNFVAEGIKEFPELTKAVLALGAALTFMGAIRVGAGALAVLTGLGGGAAAAAAGGGAAVAAGEGAAAGAAEGGAALFTGGALAKVAGGTGVTPFAIGAAARVAPPVAFLWELLHPTQANVGEAADLAKARSKFRPNAQKSTTDLDYAVRTLIGEARAGDTRGQMDVAHVIKNRMNKTGKGAADIVLQNDGKTWQFEPWGDIKTRTRLMAIDTQSPAYQQALKSWIAAMKEEDPTAGATLFVSPQGQAAKGRQMPKFAKPEDLTLAREGHEFYRGGFAGGQSAPASPGAALAAATGDTSTTNQVNIENLTINTKATDADGIARELPAAIRKQNLAVGANTGLN